MHDFRGFGTATPPLAAFNILQGLELGTLNEKFATMKKRSFLVISAIISIITLVTFACRKGDKPSTPPPADPNGPNLPAEPYNYVNQENKIPAYLLNYIASDPSIDNTPSGNPITNAGATLGRVLFYDKKLSVNNKISCSSCHLPEKAFTDGKHFSTGFEDGHTRRNSMSLTNLRYFKAKKMFWDLRAESLEAQVLMPITDPIEMGMPSLGELETKVKSVAYYPGLFKAAFGSTDVTADRISKALAQFLRSIVSLQSKYDQGLADNFAHFTQQELDGKALIRRAFCTECHSDLSHEANFTNPSFLVVENSGLNTGFGSNNGLELNYVDNGIGEKTGKAQDMGTFKIPTLRNIELTAPYMHDGRFTTLEAVMDHYASGVKNHANKGIQLFPPGFNFSAKEKSDLIAFLKTLTDTKLATEVKYSDPFKK